MLPAPMAGTANSSINGRREILPFDQK